MILNRKTMYILLISQIIVYTIYALVTEFTDTWLDAIVPGVVIVGFILVIFDAVMVVKCIKTEREMEIYYE